MSIYEDLKKYQPFNIQEEIDKRRFLELLTKYDNIFYRENDYCHLTSSAWVLNKNHDKVLMAYHNIYDSWAWLGGHNDGEEDCLKVAIKEVKEESGIEDVKPISNEIFSIEILAVDSHYKRNKYVPVHFHLNVTYLLEANDKEKLVIKEDENSGVSWFYFNEVLNKSKEKWFNENVYKKLLEKVERFYENY